MDFGEKRTEYSPKHGKELPVWQSPKYLESRAKAEEIINSNKYGLKASDFWVLMNVTKSEKMAYTGLILSHNGCLKINDCLDSKFNPACVSLDKDGYRNSLIYTYCNPEQGIYEVGEVSQSNCKNEYPYAMAFKRLFDRVVLKLSKLAYAGIYSDSEADEFAQQIEAPKEGSFLPPGPICEECGNEIMPYNDGKKAFTAQELADRSKEMFNKALCAKCSKAYGKRTAEDPA